MGDDGLPLSFSDMMAWLRAHPQQFAQMAMDAVQRANMLQEAMQMTGRAIATIGPPKVYGWWEYKGGISATQSTIVIKGRDNDAHTYLIRIRNSRLFDVPLEFDARWNYLPQYGQVLLIGKRLHLGTMRPGKCPRRRLGEHIVVPKHLCGTDTASIEQDRNEQERRTYDSSP